MTESRRLAGAGEGWELVFNGDRVSIWEDEKVLKMGGRDVNVNTFNACELCTC